MSQPVSSPPAPPSPAPAGRSPLGHGRRPLAGLLALATAVGLIAGALSGVLVARYEASRLGVCNVSDVSGDVLPAVVTILVEGANGASGSGSGAILTPDGTIVTNHHVIEAALRGGHVSVLLNNGETKPSTLVGTDAATDLAVIKVEASGLPTVALNDAAGPRVGQQVIAMGAPLGLVGTVTSGIVSALDRDIIAGGGESGMTVLAGNIQTDTAINPGNSGGPLVTCDGRLIGVNAAGATVPDAGGVTGGGSVGINFAVPSSTASRITSEILASGRATHPWIGAQTADITPALANRYGAKAGLFVQAVATDGPAARAGLRRGDVITTIAGQPASSLSLAWLLVSAKVGDQVEVEFVRGGAAQRATLTLIEQP